jgi:hypothetical protein
MVQIASPNTDLSKEEGSAPFYLPMPNIPSITLLTCHVLMVTCGAIRYLTPLDNLKNEIYAVNAILIV